MKKKTNGRTRPDRSAVDVEAVAREAKQGAAALDALREESLEGTLRGQAGKLRVLERERMRVERLARAGRVPIATLRALEERLQVVRTRAEAFEHRARRACYEWPEAREGAWILHGFVSTAGGEPLPGVDLVLNDAQGNSPAGGKGRTGKEGHFRLTVTRFPKVPEAPPRLVVQRNEMVDEPRLPELTLTLVRRDELVHRHPAPLTPRPGEVTYLDVVVPDERCPPEQGKDSSRQKR